MRRNGVLVAGGLVALAVLVWVAPRLTGGRDGSLGPAPTTSAPTTASTTAPLPVTSPAPRTPDPEQTSGFTPDLPDRGRLAAPATGTAWVVGASTTGPLLGIDAATNTVVTRVAVGGTTAGIVRLGGRVWVAAGPTGLLYAVDTATGDTRSVRVGGSTSALTTDGRRLWTLDEAGGEIHVVDPATGGIVRSYARPGVTSEIVHDGTRLWTVDGRGRRLVALDPLTGREVARVDVPATPDDLTWDGRLVWFGDGVANRLLALDPTTRKVVRTVRLGAAQPGAWAPVPTLVAATSRRVWAVTTAGDNWVAAAVDPRSGRLLATVPLPPGTGPPTSVAVVGDALWVTVGGSVLAVDPATGTLVRTAGDASNIPGT